MTPEPRPAAGGDRDVIRVDIRRVTLDGYSPAMREHYARALTDRLSRRGVPEAAAGSAAAAILDAVDARLGANGPRRHG